MRVMRALQVIVAAALSCLALFASGCAKEGCLAGEEGCVVPSPCPELVYECTGGTVSVHVVQEGDYLVDGLLPGGLDALVAPGDVLLLNDQVEVVIEALDHPHYLGPTGGGIVDLATLDDDNDSMRGLIQATGVLPDEAAYYTNLRVIDQPDLVAVQVDGHLDGRPDVRIHTRYELRPCDPGVRIRTELISETVDPMSVLLADGNYMGNRELAPFTPGAGLGFAQPSFGLSTLGDAVIEAPYVANAGHSEPAASYGQVSCSQEQITGFRSTEVALDGNARRILMPRDYEIFERVLLAAEGPGASRVIDLALETRRLLWGEEYVTISGRLTSSEPNPGFGEGLRASLQVSEGTIATPVQERIPWTHTIPDAEGLWTVRVPANRSYVLEVESYGQQRIVEAEVVAEASDVAFGQLDVPPVGRLTLNATIDGDEDHVMVVILPADDATEEAVTGKMWGVHDECAPILGHPHGPSPGCNRVMVTGPTQVGILPGTYDLFAIAGPFSTLAEARGVKVEADANEFVQLDLLTIDGLQPEGTLSGDFHVHGGASFDSNAPHRERMRSFLASRVEVIATTEHDAAWDFAAARAEFDADERVAIMTGTEATGHILFKFLENSVYPKVFGHWNIWPLPFDPEGPWRGAPWDEKVEPGMLLTRAAALGWPAEDGVFQLNHPIAANQFARDQGWVNALGLDLTVPLPSAFDDTEPGLFSRTPEGANFANDAFHTQEVMNGTNNGGFIRYRAFWHYLLNQGIVRAGTANSDSHSLKEHIVGLPLNLVRTTSTVADFDASEFNLAVRAGRMVGTSGPVLEVSTTEQGGAARGPSVEPFSPEAGATLDIRISAAPWVPVDEVRIVVNGQLVRTLTDELTAQPADPFGADELERLDVSIPLDDLLPAGGDAWLVVEAGTALEPNADLDCNGIADTGDNNRDGTIDWRDVEAFAHLDEDPGDECYEEVGPLTEPAPPEGRDGPMYLYRAVVPDGYPCSFTNPLLIDRDGDGWDAPGLSR